MAHASESGHFYDAKTGEPVYQVPNLSKPGEMRPTTLRDARSTERPLVASVTTILSILEKPQLIKWKIKQAIMASLTMPRNNMDEESWLDAIITDANQQSYDAMSLGTQVHAAIQSAYERKDYPLEFREYVTSTMVAVSDKFPYKTWICEKSFSHPLGYGGKVDNFAEDGTVVIDFKTTSLNGKKLEKAGYDEHVIQLAAYRLGLGLENATLSNVYISTSVKGEVFVKVWTEEEARLATQQWLAILNLWKLLKNFNVE